MLALSQRSAPMMDPGYVGKTSNFSEHKMSAPLQLVPRNDETVQPLPFLNPTRRRYDVLCATDSIHDDKVEAAAASLDSKKNTNAQMDWTSRDNRKGRHPLLLPRAAAPPYMERLQRILRAVWRMCTVLAWWDVSWWIAINFTFGSALFLISGCFYWMPTAFPNRVYHFSSLVAGGVTSAIGGTMFEIGGILLVVEALNADQTGCFGWALENLHKTSAGSSNSEPSSSASESENGLEVARTARFRPRKDICRHHHQAARPKKQSSQSQNMPSRPWKWWPTHHELVTHYIYEIGFLANFVMFVGATVFWITSILSLPGVFNNLSTGVIEGIYYLTYLVGAILFVISSALYIIEAQKKWYLPAPSRIAWWIAIFNMIGSIGWTFAASVGYCKMSWCAYQGDLTLIWASAAFLIASVLLWYEAIEKWPVRVQ